MRGELTCRAPVPLVRLTLCDEERGSEVSEQLAQVEAEPAAAVSLTIRHSPLAAPAHHVTTDRVLLQRLDPQPGRSVDSLGPGKQVANLSQTQGRLVGLGGVGLRTTCPSGSLSTRVDCPLHSDRIMYPVRPYFW